MKTFKALLSAAVLTASFGAQANVVDTFDSSSQYWFGSGGLPIFSWQPSGGVGNGGYLRSVDNGGGSMLVRSPVLGNLSSTFGGTLSYDYNVFSLGDNAYQANESFGTVTIASGALSVTADLIAVPATNIAGSGWHTASLALSDALWSGSGELSTILQNVTYITVNTEYNVSYRYPDEVVGFDNFSMIAPRAVPEPQMLMLLGLGLAGMACTAGRRRRSANSPRI